MSIANWFHVEATDRRSEAETGDFPLLAAWWLMVAVGIAGFDLVSARAGDVPLFPTLIEHAWQAALTTGLIGAFYADRNRMLCCLVSAIGGLATFAATALALVLLARLLA